MKMVFLTQGLPFNGKTVYEKGLGGSESCLFYMARAMAARGNEITVMNVCDKEGVYDGVTYKNLKTVAKEDADVAFSYRWPELVGQVNARVRILVCHDMPVMANQMNERLWNFQGVIFLTNYQLGEYRRIVGGIDKVAWVSANGVDWELAKEVRAEMKKEPLVLWGSRPERGLEFLLEQVWPVLKSRHPELTLGLTGYESWVDPRVKGILENCANLLRGSQGVEEFGSLSKPDWYRLLAKAQLVLYPCKFPEIYCLNATESAACGTPIITTDSWALKETAKHGVLVSGSLTERADYAERFVAATERMLADIDGCYQNSVRAGLEYTKALDWNVLAGQWEEYAQRLLKEEAELNPKLSVCMIVRDEEHNVGRALASVKGIADEMLVYDAQSEDGTVEAAKRMGATVRTISNDPDGDGLFNFGWARNKSIEHATGDWILWIDADEVLVGADKLRKYMRSRANGAFRVRQVNLNVLARQPGFETPIRLFKRGNGAKFVGVLHETMEFADDVGSIPYLRDAEIIHYGYVVPDANFEKLLKRNLALLDKERRMGIRRQIMPVYVMRDWMNLANREVNQHGLTERAETLLWHIVDEGRMRLASPASELHRKLMSDMTQTALKLLAKSPKYKASIKLIEVGVRVTEAGSAPGNFKKVELLCPSGREARRIATELLESELAAAFWADERSRD